VSQIEETALSDEIKKDDQVPEPKTEATGESLPEPELDKAVGGTAVSLSYGKLEWKYGQQKSDD
jgi:hypothetical protein